MRVNTFFCLLDECKHVQYVVFEIAFSYFKLVIFVLKKNMYILQDYRSFIMFLLNVKSVILLVSS
jgi:hypothetical protein